MSYIQSTRQASRQMVRELDVIKGVFQRTGFTYSQCHLLFELEQHQQLNLMELSAILLLDKSTTSRIVNKLIDQAFVKVTKTAADKRQKLFSLTAKGQKAVNNNNCLADEQVENAMQLLSEEEQAAVTKGLNLYAKALQKSRLQKPFQIRLIRKKDNPIVARIIREVMTEFQAIGEGYSYNDPEVDFMYEAYRAPKHAFYVLEKEGQVLGCGGIAPLKGGTATVCELRKMYYLPEVRGLGLGKKLLVFLLDEAQKLNYKQCYLETVERMWQASLLYQKVGFKKIKSSMGNTGHCTCDLKYLRDL